MKVNEQYNEIFEFISTADNLIEGQRAELLDFDGNVPIVKAYRRNEVNTDFLDLLTIEPGPEQHLDILSSTFTLSYQLGVYPVEVDRFVLLGLANGVTDYSIREFELYFSDNKEKLFSKESLFYTYKNDKEFTGKENSRDGCQSDVMLTFDQSIKAKFFGLRVSKENRTDDISRLGHLGLYSNTYSETYSFLHKYFGKNALSQDKITICGDYKGFKAALCDDLAFNDEGICVEDAVISITERAAVDCTHVYVAANMPDAILIDGARPVCISAPCGEFLYYCENDCSKKIVINIKKPVKITEIGLNCGVRHFEVCDKVITDNFYGIGTNSLPMAFMDVALANGYNEALWLEECRRVMISPPNVARMWFQPDWFIIDKDSYYNHVYNFDSQKMKSVYKYLDLYLKIGTEIELNFGWKVDETVWDWYCIPGVEQKKNSAPADLDEFAYSCAAALKELIENRGYTNIKYLTFYNEPNWNLSDEGDFVVSPPIDRSTITDDYKHQDKVDYWIEMLRKTKVQLNQFGLDYLELWGPETSCGDASKIYWAKEFSKVDDILDVHTTHRYNLSDNEVERFCGFMKDSLNKPLLISEFNSVFKHGNWKRNVIEMVIQYARNGACGALVWLQSGVFLSGCASFALSGPDCCWNEMSTNPDGVNQNFYNLCLFMRYVPCHSKVLYSSAYSSDTRVVAFLTPAGDTVIAIESKRLNSNRTFNITLPDNSPKTFYRFTVNDKMDLSRHAHQPYCSAIIKAEGIIKDTIDEGYTLNLYTTERPLPQIVCNKGYVELNGGESHQISYEIHDTEAEKVKMTIAEGEQLISINGNTVTAKHGVSGTAAIRVELPDTKTECYDIVLVKVL